MAPSGNKPQKHEAKVIKDAKVIKKTPSVGFSTTVATLNGPSPMGIAYPKGWEELNDTEKIERLHEIVKNMLNIINNSISPDLNYFKEILFKHYHGEQGRLLIEPNRYRDSGIGGTTMASSANHKSYF